MQQRIVAKWTRAEDRILKRMYEDHTTEAIARQLPGRSAENVGGRAKRLKLKKYKAENLTGWRPTYSEIVDAATGFYNNGMTIEVRDRAGKYGEMEYAVFRVYPHSLKAYRRSMGLTSRETACLSAG